MKTRDRILHVSLALFNEEGEADQTALDIANALEISPGNLYYHFKGKDAIIHALFERFEEEMMIILNGAKTRLETLEDYWVFLYILLEEIYDFRFFYRNLGVLLNHYPDLAIRFRKLSKAIRQTVGAKLDDLIATGERKVTRDTKTLLLDQIMMNLTHWLADDLIRGKGQSEPKLIHETVYRICSLGAPYLRHDPSELQADILAEHKRVLRTLQ